MTKAKPMSDGGAKNETTVWLDADAAFVERLAREAQLKDESIEEFVEKSIRQRSG